MVTTRRSAKGISRGLSTIAPLLLGIASIGLAGCAGLVSGKTTGSGNPSALTISNAQALSPTTTSFLVEWVTSAPANSQVNYGKTSSYGNSTAVDTTMVINHQLSLASLTAGTAYHFQIHSTDTNGHSAVTGDMVFSTSSTTSPLSVSITSPAASGTLTGTVTIVASATDTAGVPSVQFKVDGASVGAPVASAPYTFSLNTKTLTGGTHILTATASDAAGNTATSSQLSVTVNNSGDTTPPTVSMTAPANGATVSNTVAVSASATDNVAVASVQFQLDNANIGAAVTTAPYSYSWNTRTSTNGTHTLRAIATDTSNNSATSASVTVTVSNVKDTTPPTVSMTAPANGATVSNTVAVSASATDNVAVASVQFQLDNANIGAAVTTAPYSYSWNTTTSTNGTHTLRAIATDTSNNSATSASVTVTVSNVKDTTPPTVSITSPASGSSVSGTINVTATASDNVGVAGVQFQVDGGNTGAQVTSSPYTFALNTLSYANGSHTLTAVATDTANNKATSSPVSITVNNASSGSGGVNQPGGAGWYPLGSISIQGNVCPADNYGGYGYNFAQYCDSQGTGNVHAWGSGMFDVKRDRLLFWGGGHNDYYGNEVYGLEFPAGQMVRYNPPSPPNGPFSGGQAPGSSSCVDTLSDNRPNSRHIYGELVYIAHADRMWIWGGSAACQTGGPVNDTWTLDLSSIPRSDASNTCEPNCSASWQRMDNSYSKTSPCPATIQAPTSDLSFGDDSAAYNPNDGMVYHQDGAGTLRKYDFDHNCWTILNSSFVQYGQGTNSIVDASQNVLWLFGAQRDNATKQLVYVNLSGSDGYAPHDVTSSAVSNGCGPVLGAYQWVGLAWNSDLGQIAAWYNGSGTIDTIYTMNDSTLSSPVCTANTYSGGPPYVDDPDNAGSPLTRGALGRFSYDPIDQIYTTVNDATTQAFYARLTSYTAADVDYSSRCWQPDSNLLLGLRRCWGFNADIFRTGPGPQGQPGGGHIQDHASQGFPSPTIDAANYSSGGGSLKFVLGPTGFESAGGSFALNACGYTNGPDDLKHCTWAVQNAGDEIWIQWRQYMDSNYLSAKITTSDGTTQGAKQIIIADEDVIGGTCGNGVLSNGVCVANACSDDEQVMQNVSDRGIPGNYFMCGSPVGGYDNYNTFINGAGIALQNGSGSAATCLYQANGPPYSSANCFLYAANEWTTWQIHLKLGTGGFWDGSGGTDALTSCPAQFKNSMFELYAAHAGQPSVLVQHYGPDTSNGFCWYNPSGYPFGKAWMLDFLTNFSGSDVAMTTWIDELIVSSTKIADPK
jgi:hypothetical protein